MASFFSSNCAINGRGTALKVRADLDAKRNPQTHTHMHRTISQPYLMSL